MITINHQKTYTLELAISTKDSHYQLFRDAFETQNDKPFLYSEEIFAFINKECTPLVPLKTLRDSCGYRLYKDHRNTMHCTVTFYGTKKEINFVL